MRSQHLAGWRSVVSLHLNAACLVVLVSLASWLVASTAELNGQEPKTPAAAAAQPLPSNAQVVQLYHGESSIDILFDQYNAVSGVRGLKNPLIYPQGTTVCLEVRNAHPVLYTYSLDVVVDSTKEQVKGLAEFTKTLISTSGIGEITGLRTETEPARATPRPARPWVADYYNKLKRLRAGLSYAEGIAATSELPEGREDAAGERAGNRAGLRWAKHELQTADTLKELRDTSLAKTLDELYKASRTAAIDDRQKSESNEAARSSVKDPTEDDVALLDGLKNYGTSIVLARDALFKAYEAAKTTWSDCRVVGKYPFTMSVSVKRKSAGTAKRFEGDKARSVTVTPRYKWPLLEVSPSALYVYSPNAPAFTVQNGIVRQGTDEFRWRLGTVLVANALPLGEEADVNLGGMVGLGWLDAKGQTPVDILFGGVMSVRNLLRIGLGFGSTSRPDHLKAPGVVDQALPAGTTTLDSLVVNRRRVGLFATIMVTGWSIKTPF
jgi:hypothetical protein